MRFQARSLVCTLVTLLGVSVNCTSDSSARDGDVLPATAVGESVRGAFGPDGVTVDPTATTAFGGAAGRGPGVRSGAES